MLKTFIIILFTCLLVFPQDENIYIRKDDSGLPEDTVKTLLVSIPTVIHCRGEIVDIECSNGRISFEEHYSYSFSITAIMPGEVRITVKAIRNADTLTFVKTFNAILPPRFKIVLVKDEFYLNKKLYVKVIDADTKKVPSERYGVAGLPICEVFDENSELQYEVYTGYDTLEFSDDNMSEVRIDYSIFENMSSSKERKKLLKNIKKGYTIRFCYGMRDQLTGLPIPTQDLIYIITK